MKPTHHLSPRLYLDVVPAADSTTLHLAVKGLLDYENGDDFLEEATRHMTARPELHDLRLDCSGLEGIDSTGLSVFLMLHRRTTAAGVTLRLESRPAFLERLLNLTGTLPYLAPAAADPTSRARRRNVDMAYGREPQDGMSADPPGAGPRASRPETTL
ncbi:STAS domain-containing protein [Streptomyces sp. NPDC052225]|uniref:STAS domain-containing protein n=1 Tax=Streptomyces sp. NPDC052225 TaxID=3154949 RepID=UPI00343D0C48